MVGYIIVTAPREDSLLLSITQNDRESEDAIFSTPIMDNCLLALNGVLREIGRNDASPIGYHGNHFYASEDIVNIIKRIEYDYSPFIPY
jgi:hypothetical protein